MQVPVDNIIELQKEMHEFIEEMKERAPYLDYDNCKTVFFLFKIAELQKAIKSCQ